MGYKTILLEQQVLRKKDLFLLKDGFSTTTTARWQWHPSVPFAAIKVETGRGMPIGRYHNDKSVCWWDLLEEKVIDLLSDEGSESQELSVYPMQHSLQKIALSWVFTIEQLQQLKHELLINHFFANTWLEVWRLEKSEKKLVHKLQEKFEVIVVV